MAPRLAIAWILLFCSAIAHAQDDDEPAEPPAGWIATYTGADGRAHKRIDERLRFVWKDASPDPRLPAGPFRAHWSGYLAIDTPGTYRFYVYAGGGAVEMQIGGKKLIAGETRDAQWFDSAPVELDFGAQPVEVAFRTIRADAQIGLYWSGPKFQLEPLPPRLLSHAAGQEALQEFEQGRLLARALRCAACHELPDAQPTLPAPALTHVRGNLDHEWLMTWIGGKPEAGAAVKAVPAAPAGIVEGEKPIANQPAIDNVKFRMPGLGISRADARHIAAWLTEHSKPAPSSDTEPKEVKAARDPAAKETAKAEVDAETDAGEELFLTMGCLACHQFKSLGVGGVYGGGDLSTVGAKRPVDFFARWLAAPEASNPAHRMPVFPLSPEQREDLAKFLSAQGKPDASPRDEPAGDGRRGAELISSHRCAACHSLDAKDKQAAPQSAAVAKKRLTADADWSASCLGEPDVARRRPGYRLRPEQRRAVEHYVREMVETPKPAAPKRESHPDAARLFAERNCLACHSRGLHVGIASLSPALAEAHPELASLLPALAPPSLSDVGDKLEREAIIAAFTTSSAPLRPWLKIRMPRFAFTPDESQALADWFAAGDLIPERRGAASPRAIDGAAQTVAGRRLVTAEGFGCASCHQIGRAIPKQDNLAAMGTDLSLVGRRIRRPWYDRWVRNPARIVPRMEMPSIDTPVRGVLDERLDDQLAAVWQVLNLPNFTPPEPGAVRMVRTRNMPDAHEPATVLTDVITIDRHPFLRPFIAALPNRHTVLFDLEQNRLAGWWIGDAAAQRTRGKTWYWEAAGTHL
ncbi:MAG TPA: c-type cytochrome, partial [Pirellulales bacterium]